MRTPPLPRPAQVVGPLARRLLLGTGLALAPSAVVPSSLGAQALRLRVVDSVTAFPLPGALLDLELPDGRLVLQSFTSPDGRRLLPVPQPGDYRLRVRRLGHRPWVSPTLRIDGADTLVLTVQVPSRTVRLPIVAQRERDVCGLNAARNQHEAARIVGLWEQIRTTLELTQASRAELAADASVAIVGRFISRIGPKGQAVLRHTVLPVTRGAPRPFETFPPELVEQNGYVRQDEEGTTYIAPDERTLLSGGFTATHCFRLVRGRGENAGSLGIAFTPNRSRRAPEIAGTVWADSATGALRLVEFRYVNVELPDEARGTNGAGGEAHFAKTATGNWIISAWRLRLPKIWFPPWDRGGALLYFSEVGGVAEFARAGDAPVEHASVGRLRERLRPGTLVLVLRDTLGLGPIPGAWVELRQRRDSAARLFEAESGAGAIETQQPVVARGAVADSAGLVRLDDLPPGRYDLRYHHPALERIGVEPPSAEVAIAFGRPFELMLTPTPTMTLRKACNIEEKTELHGVLQGVVFEGDGALAPDARPVPDARVTVSWIGADGVKVERRESVGDRGEYTFCDLPADADLTVQASISRSRSSGALSGAAVRTESPVVRLRLAPWKARYLRLTVKTNPLT